MLWLKALLENFRGEVSVEKFLAAYLPRPSTEASDKILRIVQTSAQELEKAGLAVRRAPREAKMYMPLVKYLNVVVSDFPASTKPEFHDTHSTRIPSIHPDDHDTAPDITATRSALWGTVDEAKDDEDDEEDSVSDDEKEKWKGLWPEVGTVLELKLKVDIFTKEGLINLSDESADALIQIAKSARSLLACGRCFAFVVAVVGIIARILRFDRAGWKASAAFDWTQDTDIIPKFFWRLYNPEKQNNQRVLMYGDDDSILIPTPEEKQKMYDLWKKTSSYQKAPLSFEEATGQSRWMKASKDDESVLCFTIGPPLSQSDGLFSRATRVDRVVLKDDPVPTTYVLKDAWRQLCRRPEIDFYDTIKRYCQDQSIPMTGMAQCIGSVELQGHETIFASLDEQQRYHMRSLLTPVGIPLKRFPSTKQLVLALEAAMKQHKTAREAGVLHRDISEDNVLFDEKTMDGFLVDWDYAEFTPEGKLNFENWFPDRANARQYMDINRSLKDFTGTFPFMAIDILNDAKDVIHAPKHDLESFYYLLVWMVLRHTPSDPGLKETHAKICHDLFDNYAAVAVKREWLAQPTVLCAGNPPLFAIVDILRDLFCRQNPLPLAPVQANIRLRRRPAQAAPEPEDVTYEDVFDIFEQCLAQEDWPKDDGAIRFVPYSLKEGKSQNKSCSLARAAIENSQGRREGSGGGSAMVTRSAGSGSGSKRREREYDPAHDTASTSNSRGSTSDNPGDEASEPATKKSRTISGPKPEAKSTIKSRMKPKQRSTPQGE